MCRLCEIRGKIRDLGVSFFSVMVFMMTSVVFPFGKMIDVQG